MNLLFQSIALTFQQQQNYYRVEHKWCTCCTKKISKLDMLNYRRQTQVGLLRLDNVVLFRSKILQALTRIFKIVCKSIHLIFFKEKHSTKLFQLSGTNVYLFDWIELIDLCWWLLEIGLRSTRHMLNRCKATKMNKVMNKSI